MKENLWSKIYLINEISIFWNRVLSKEWIPTKPKKNEQPKLAKHQKRLNVNKHLH